MDVRVRRHKKIRRKIIGDTKRPRLAVYKSNKHICAQIIDDSKGKTLVFESDIKIDKTAKAVKAYEVGKNLARKALKNKITSVVFDRGGFSYHGRIESLARGAREGGLKF